jgi:hypothetical protein
MPTILMALRERKVPSNAPNEQLGHDAPDIYSAERESEVRNQCECEDQGTVAERLPEAPPEHTFDDDDVSEGSYYTARSEGFGGESRCPGNILSINIHQFRRVFGRIRRFGLPPSSLTFQRSPQMDSVISGLS